jgi:hypothetical protein
VTTEPPAALTTAVMETLAAATDAALAADPVEEHRILVDAILGFPGRAQCDDLYPATWALVAACCVAIRESDRGGDWDNTDGQIYLGADDPVTGKPVDPDVLAAGSPVDQGKVAAVRLLTAWCNGDPDGARSFFNATVNAPDDDETAGARYWALIYQLLRMAGGYVIEGARRGGTLRAGDQARLVARKKTENEGTRHTTTSGSPYQSMPIDQRDSSPDDRHLAGPHGDALYMVTAYPTGVVGGRDRFTAMAHREIEGTAERDGLVICPVLHCEDVEVWQLPHALRPALRSAMRDMRRQSGRPPATLRCWRHRGATCPDTTPATEDTPLF